MSRLRIFAVRLLNLFRRGPLERELDAELQTYLELDIDENIRRGMAPKEARRTALARLGGLEMTTIKEQCRDVHRFRALDDLWRDFQFGFRRLHARPVLAVVAVAVLAIGIGANTAIFALLDALLLRPLPGPDPHRLAVVSTSDFSSGRPSANSYPDYLDIRESTPDVFEHLSATSFMPVGVRIGGETRVMSAQIVEPNYFDTMGLGPVHGRAFEAVEAGPVAVIGNGVWLSEFGADPSVLGRAITVNGLPFTVVGVAPLELGGLFGGTQGLLRVDVWLPAAFEQSVRLGDARQEQRSARGYDIVGRLREGVGIDEARTRLDVVGRRLHQSYPEAWTGLSGQPRALTIRAANEARLPSVAFGPLAVLTGLVGTLLFIVCANISGLLLADASVRRREMSIRRALGASRFRLVRQVAVESLGLGLVAGGLGVAAASAAISFVTLLVPDLPLPVPLRLNLEPNWRLLAAALVVSSGVGLLVGFLPALYATQAKPRLGGFSQTRLRNTLTAMQAAAAVFLLIIAGTFAHSIVAAYAVPLGYDSDELTLVTVDLEAAGYSEERGRAYLRQVFEQVPTAETSEAPFLSLQAQSRRGISVDGYQPRAGERMSVHANVVSPGYVRMMGVPLLRGRDLESGERNAVLVNRAFAERFWPGQNAVGRRLRRSTREEILRQMRGDPAPVAGGAPWSTVVGVVDDGHFVSFREDAVPVLFASMENVYSPQVTFHMRGVSAEAAREGIGRIDPDVPIVNVATMADMVDTALLPAWIAAVVSGFVGAGGLLLACIGLFGTLSYVVALRAPEIGLRVALGARPLQIIRLVAGSASVKLVTVGVVVGAGLGSGVSPLFQAQFSRAQGVDPLALAGVAACLALVASVAVGLPVARALRIDPAEVLRVDE